MEAVMLKEFQEFIAKGNVMDLAVGVIIGGAFGLIVSSESILMPMLMRWMRLVALTLTFPILSPTAHIQMIEMASLGLQPYILMQVSNILMVSKLCILPDQGKVMAGKETISEGWYDSRLF